MAAPTYLASIPLPEPVFGVPTASGGLAGVCLLLFCLVLLRRIVVLSCVQLIQVRLALLESKAFVLPGLLCPILFYYIISAGCVPLSASCCAVVL